MKLLRFGLGGSERPGIIDADGNIRDLSSIVDDITGDILSEQSLGMLRNVGIDRLPLAPDGSRYGPCVANIGKFICVGLNYADHAAESGLPVPEEPVLFMKATSAIIGPNDAVLKPRGSTKLDWEVELGVVIGRRAAYVSEAEAPDYIAGYCTINDISERSFQLERGGTWDKGKACAVDSTPSSCRPPWFETTIASAPKRTASSASSGSRIPLIMILPCQKSLIQSRSDQDMLGSKLSASQPM